MGRNVIGWFGLIVVLVACGRSPNETADEAVVTIVPFESTAVPLGAVPTVPIGVTPDDFTPPPQVTSDPVPAVEDYDPFAERQPFAKVAYGIPPNVQHVTENSAQILFQLDKPSPGVILYRPVGGGVETLNLRLLDPTEDRHFLTLEDLAPASEYEFLVRLGDGPLETLLDVPFEGSHWPGLTFRTPPYGESLRFAVVGDSGYGEPVTYALSQLIEDFDPHFVLHVGDLVYLSDRNSDPYEAYHFKFYGPFVSVLKEVPIYPALGNHDLSDPAIVLWDRPFYFWAFPPIDDPQFEQSAFGDRRKWYAFEANGVQFISLNTQAFFGDSGRQEQLDWLSERLADTRFRYSIAYFHVPPYSSSIHHEESPAVLPLAQMLEQAGVPLVFSGHDHVYERLTGGPTTYVITGGGSAGLYTLEEEHPNSEVFESRTHFVMVEITSETIEVEAIGTNGEPFDSFTLDTP